MASHYGIGAVPHSQPEQFPPIYAVIDGVLDKKMVQRVSRFITEGGAGRHQKQFTFNGAISCSPFCLKHGENRGNSRNHYIFMTLYTSNCPNVN